MALLQPALKSRTCRTFLALTLSAAAAAAHSIPNDVTIQLLLKPEGHRLLLAVRVPSPALRDVSFPSRDAQGYLDIKRARLLLPDAAATSIAEPLEVYADDVALPKPRVLETRLALLSDRSFTSWDQALAHLTGPGLPDDTTILWNQTLLDVLFEYPIRSDRARFSIRPGGLADLGVRTVIVLRFISPGDVIRAFEFEGDPGLVHLDPRWFQAAERFVRMGFLHILDGTDHLLFLFCLVVPLRSLRALIPVVTAFTVAHSITLIASAYGYAPDALWFPPLIELLIALSIFYMALENIVVASGEGRKRGQRRWPIAFLFGLVHGFGFSFALRQTLQFAGNHLLASLLSFNVGVELGQLLVLLLLIPVLSLTFHHLVSEGLGVMIASAIAADIGGHWMVERWGNLSRYRISPPEWNPLLLLTLARGTLVAVIGGGVWWFSRDLWRKHHRAANAQATRPEL